MYIITGASGNTGKIIANALLDADKKVRVISRNTEKVKNLAAKGAETAIG
ncbi:NmrA family NAD(P)-binding protein, partial [Candidatus Saccharibacteria bacterium]|nr:NmrA family NAD(P)-binding protein [Candidatus Saccharibacteria bacterium]NIV03823.1 NmrA family NAD(P)-binding protein [Calditrichia bacterium]NIV72978.1 NmrA family NAD(P)-binding protein [Calditrichia bacterium]NIV99865.1 NmrA family NAD(P)-binding protein [Candidatus Saccharibacteria bacterium]NIW79315.1 NmrA family NAD(P)-binding protein [Calditrichia bacterium]